MSYIDDVASHLAFRGSARAQALNDLRDLLTTISPEELGSPDDYAAALNEQFGSTDGPPEHVLGMPLSLISGLGERLAGTFDPADERLMVPRLFGLGWTVNMGRVAVKLGLLRPDDVDDEILDEATAHLGTPQIAAALAIAGAGTTTALLAHNRTAVEARTGESLTSSVIFGTLLPVISAALLAASADPTHPPAQRLTMPAVAASLATLSAAACAQKSRRLGGDALVLAGAAVAGAGQLGLSYLPVRAALRARWARVRNTHHA